MSNFGISSKRCSIHPWLGAAKRRLWWIHLKNWRQLGNHQIIQPQQNCSLGMTGYDVTHHSPSPWKQVGKNEALSFRSSWNRSSGQLKVYAVALYLDQQRGRQTVDLVGLASHFARKMCLSMASLHSLFPSLYLSLSIYLDLFFPFSLYFIFISISILSVHLFNHLWCHSQDKSSKLWSDPPPTLKRFLKDAPGRCSLRMVTWHFFFWIQWNSGRSFCFFCCWERIWSIRNLLGNDMWTCEFRWMRENLSFTSRCQGDYIITGVPWKISPEIFF